jgi:hypothetical protein
MQYSYSLVPAEVLGHGLAPWDLVPRVLVVVCGGNTTAVDFTG